MTMHIAYHSKVKSLFYVLHLKYITYVLNMKECSQKEHIFENELNSKLPLLPDQSTEHAMRQHMTCTHNVCNTCLRFTQPAEATLLETKHVFGNWSNSHRLKGI